jgi:hypothetical protein
MTSPTLARGFGCLALAAIAVVACLAESRAQDLTSGQFWADARATYRFSGVTRLSGEVGYRTDFSDASDWTRLYSRWRMSWDILEWLQLNPEIFGDYTNFDEFANTFELRPAVGARILVYWPTRRFRIDSFTRLEYRYFFVEGGTAEGWWRLRTRLGGLIALNRATLLADRTLFAIIDVEPFVSFEEGTAQAFADRLRLRLGLAYRHTYRWRFEAIYTGQRARLTTEEKFELTDHIVRMRLKYFIN